MSLNSAPGRTRGAFGLPAAAKRCLFVGRGPRLLWTAGAEVFLDPKRAKTRRLLRSTPRYFIVPGHNPDHTCRDKI